MGARLALVKQKIFFWPWAAKSTMDLRAPSVALTPALYQQSRACVDRLRVKDVRKMMVLMRQHASAPSPKLLAVEFGVTFGEFCLFHILKDTT